MADQLVTREKLINADIDVDNLGKAANEETIVTPRYGDQYKSAPLAIKEIEDNGVAAVAALNAKADEVVAQGFYRGYTTEALLLAAKPAVAEMRARADDTRKIYRWNRTSAEGVTPITGTWVDTGLSELDLAKADATTKADAAEANAKDYADNATEPKLLSGLDIYYQAKESPSKTFQAIWQEYNKPVWYIGNSTFVDTTGATLSLVEPELVFTIKLTADNETFIYPTRSAGAPIFDASIDWGDGTTTNHTSYAISHTYTGAIGDEFQIKLRGVMPSFDFSTANGSRRTSRFMLKSIDKNTMPKTMTYFSLVGCTNLAYLCRGAYSSWVNTLEFNPNFSLNSPNVTFHQKAFEGLESVTDISNMFAMSVQVNSFDIPTGLLDPFVNATTAVGLFRGISKPLPMGVIDKLVNLEDVSNMFSAATITSIDNRIFKNQTKLKNVSSCFSRASSLVADAFQLYTDMNQGNPTTVNGCFYLVGSMTNLASVPAAWKTL